MIEFAMRFCVSKRNTRRRVVFQLSLFLDILSKPFGQEVSPRWQSPFLGETSTRSSEFGSLHHFTEDLHILEPECLSNDVKNTYCAFQVVKWAW